MLIAAHLGFCSECYETLAWKEKDGMPVLTPRKKQSLVDLAIEHELADSDSVHEILERAYGKMRKKLGESDRQVFHLNSKVLLFNNILLLFI